MLKLSMSSGIKRLLKNNGLCLLALAALLLAQAQAAPASGEGPLEELIEKQKSLKSVHAAFVQEKYDPMLARPIRSAGDFYFKPGVGVRWEYEDVLVIYDGTVLYIYSPEMDEAEKLRGQQGFMGPLAFDVEELLRDYDIRASRDGGAINLLLKPKKDMPFESMTMVFPEGKAFPSEVTVNDDTGASAVITFEEPKINASFSDRMLEFHPPPGTSIIERRFE